MLRSPVLTTVALLALGFGIGANTAIFSFLDALMLRSLPVKAPSQLVLLGKGEWSGISDAAGMFWCHIHTLLSCAAEKQHCFQ
jgi:hypothetical protein